MTKKIVSFIILLSVFVGLTPAHADNNVNKISQLNYPWVALDAKESVIKSYNPEKQVKPNIKYYISDKVSQEIISHYKKSAEVVHNIFSDYNPPTYSEVLIWTEHDMDWSNRHHNIITRNQIAEWRARLFNCNSAYADKVDNVQIIVVCVTPNALSELGRREVMAHEYFHLVQGSNNMFIDDVPCWIIEGMASFYGATLGGTLYQTHDFYTVHSESRVFQLGNKPIYELVPQKTVEIFKLMEDRTCGFFSGQPYVGSAYILGAFAFEALTAAYGQDYIANFIKLFNTNSNWRQNFEKTFGINPDKFYQSLAPYVEWRVESLKNRSILKISREEEKVVQDNPVTKDDQAKDSKGVDDQVKDNQVKENKDVKVTTATNTSNPVVINKIQKKKHVCIKNKKTKRFISKCPKGWVKK